MIHHCVCNKTELLQALRSAIGNDPVAITLFRDDGSETHYKFPRGLSVVRFRELSAKLRQTTAEVFH